MVRQTVEANLGNCREVAANIGVWAELVRRETVLYTTLNRCCTLHALPVSGSSAKEAPYARSVVRPGTHRRLALMESELRGL